ncbi:MAG: carbamoyl-phosphate synthase large subunit, partial [Bacteroidetes bacterium]|nr:carbamoyl-phosphate synthase large subunit [Bacteroidota bacterium]
EIMQKGLRMIGQGMHGFVGNNNLEVDDLDKALEHPTDQRIFFIDVAFQRGYSIDKIHELTKIDKWFLEKLQEIHLFAEELKKFNKIEDLSSQQILKAKQLGFSDFQIARFVDKEAGNMEEANHRVRNYRKKLNILPTVKRINTVAAEHPELTNYLYLTYDGTEHDIPFYKSDKSVIVLGSGAYRIGSSVEFDWCSVNAAQTARKLGYRTIMINYNPETVSTDYDICDKLYMDELSMERVLDIIELELPKGVILSMGGQIPNNLAMKLHRQHIPVLGTSPISIDRAENRHKFSLMLDQLGIDQPKWIEATTLTDVYNFCDQVGFPVLIRPSYVLSGAAMNVCTNKADLDHFLTLASKVSKEHPVVVSKFLENAKEIEFDAVAHNGDVIEYAISEHIEFAGVHSGDATLVFPPQKIYFETGRRIKKISKQIAKELNISGPFNIQFLAVNNDIKVIECNLRASRSFPFVSKILKRNFIDTATKIMLDAPYTKADKTEFDIDYIGVKSPMFSFSRLQQADPILGVDMSSTGEVGCIGNNFEQAIITSMLAVGYKIPKNIMLSTGETKSKVDMLEACRSAVKHGCNLFATRGTRNFLKEHNIPCKLVHWSDEKCENNVIDMINNHEFDLVVNIPKDRSLNELNSDFLIRRTAIDRNVPLITNARLAAAFIDAISEYNIDDITIKSWDEYKI